MIFGSHSPFLIIIPLECQDFRDDLFNNNLSVLSEWLLEITLHVAHPINLKCCFNIRPLATLGSRRLRRNNFFSSAFWDLHVLVLKPKSDRQPDNTWCIFSRGTSHNFQQLEVLGKNCGSKFSNWITFFSETVRLGVQRPSPVVKQHRCHGQERKRCTTWNSRGRCFWWVQWREKRRSVLDLCRGGM